MTELQKHIRDTWLNAARSCRGNTGFLPRICQMLCSYPNQEELLQNYLKTLNECTGNKINVSIFIKLGMMLAAFPLTRLIEDDLAKAMENEIEAQKYIEIHPDSFACGIIDPNDLPASKYHPDERVEFARIYIERFLGSHQASLEDSLRAYALKLNHANATAQDLARLKRRYYRFIKRFYGCDKTDYQDNPDIFPHDGLDPMLDRLADKEDGIPANLSAHHRFLMQGKYGDFCCLLYRKTPRTYWLKSGSVISLKFTASAKRYEKIIEKLRKEYLLHEENQEHGRLRRSIKISSSSCAASLVMGTNLSGNSRWVNQYGKTLKQVQADERKSEKNSKILRQQKKSKEAHILPPTS